MIYVTGDTHGIEFKKLNTKNFKEQKHLTKNDYVIITGDFGLVWDNSAEERYWLNWLDNKNFTVLFIDGNHENFNLLNKYPIENWHGGKIHKISNSIFHLMRGQVFTINDKKIFTFGGAKSHDKKHRITNISWWQDEIPSIGEFNEAINNLKHNDNEIDYIITHTCDSKLLESINKYFHYEIDDDPTNAYLNDIRNMINYKKWYFGHFHKDVNIDNKHYILYSSIRNIETGVILNEKN